jgi:hypothetical protein
LGLILLAGGCDNPAEVEEDESGNVRWPPGGCIPDWNVLAWFELEEGEFVLKYEDRDVDFEQRVITYDLFLENRSYYPIRGPFYIALTEIAPASVELLNPDGHTLDGHPYMLFDKELILDPLNGLSSTKQLRFSFDDNIRITAEYRLDFSDGTLGDIAGMVFHDRNENGLKDDNETRVGNIPLTLSYVTPQAESGPVAIHSGISGRYRFRSLPAGDYMIHVDLQDPAASTTTNPIVVTLTESDKGVVLSSEDNHFGILFNTNPLVLNYNFDDGVLPEWGKSLNMSMDIVEGILKLTSVNGRGARTNPFLEPAIPTTYCRGTIEFKVKFVTADYMFNVYGHPEANVHGFGGGLAVVVERSRIRVWKEGDWYRPDFEIRPDTWYIFKLEIDNGIGTAGGYSLYVEDTNNEDPAVKLGDFDYSVQRGRLVDIYGFAINVGGSLLIDYLNINLQEN